MKKKEGKAWLHKVIVKKQGLSDLMLFSCNGYIRIWNYYLSRIEVVGSLIITPQTNAWRTDTRLRGGGCICFSVYLL